MRLGSRGLVACGLFVAGLVTSGCGKKADNGKVLELASQLDQCSNDLKAAEGKLSSCTTGLAAAQNSTDTNTVTVKVVGDVMTLEARKTGGGGSRPPDEITSEEAQRVYAAVIKVFRANKQAFQVCYDRALKGDNSLANQTLKSQVFFTVESDGRLTGANVTPKIGKTYNECAETSMAKWRFTAFSGKSMKFSLDVTLTSQDK